MHDPTPAPYGTVTRRWSWLTDPERDRHAHRLLGVDLAHAHIDRPELHTAEHYRQLLAAARGDDEIAFAWLACSHRPLLLVRGRALYTADVAEWGAVALEVLHATIHHVDLQQGRWLRSTVSQRLTRLMDQHVRAFRTARRHERLLEPQLLHRHAPPVPAVDADEHPELSAALATLLARLDVATRAGLIALADRDSLELVAAAHALTDTALRQRITRARHRLQPHLAAYHRPIA
jgi:hypothetical protein